MGRYRLGLWLKWSIWFGRSATITQQSPSSDTMKAAGSQVWIELYPLRGYAAASAPRIHAIRHSRGLQLHPLSQVVDSNRCANLHRQIE